MQKQLKRYLLFGGDFYYPNGGASDLIGDFETAELALKAAAENQDIDWSHVFDKDTGEIVDKHYKDQPVSPQSRENPLGDD